MEIYLFAVGSLGESNWTRKKDGTTDGRPGACLVEYYYSHVDARTEEEMPRRFADGDSKCQCVIATIAFGLRIQIPDVRIMINWGPPKIILDYWQHVGRAGRDGQCSQALLYLLTRAMDSRRVESSVLELVNNGDSQCIRKNALCYLQVHGISDEDIVI